MAKTAAEYAAELGRAQNAYKEYGAAGRKDLQKGASTYADKLRAEAQAGGVSLGGLGTTNQYGTDYTSYYTADKPAAAYDSTKPGLVQRVDAGANTGGSTTGGGSTGLGGTNSTPSSDLITRIYDGNREAQLQGLRKARDTALQGLTGIETTAKQTAYANRNSADVANTQNVQRLREMMASQGLLASGDNITASTNLAADRMGAINDINQGESNTLTDVAGRRALINNNAAGDENALMQQLAAARDNMLLNQFNTDRGFGLQEKQFDRGIFESDRNFGRGVLVDDRNFDRGVLESNRTFDFQKSTQEWNQAFQQGQFDYQKASDVWERAFKDKSFDQSVKQFAQSMGLNWAQLNQSQQHFVADQAFKNKSFDLQKDQFDWSKNADNPDNKYKEWQMDPNNPNNIVAGPKATTYDQAYKDIDSSPYLSSLNGVIAVTDPKGLGDYIFSLGLPEADTKKLYSRYKLTWGG